MHPQNTDTEKDVSQQTGKGKTTEDERQLKQAIENDAEESAQRRDRQNSVGSDNQPMERRGTNMDKF